jgi:hypothetical protein
MMTPSLEMVLEKVKELSSDELLTVLESVTSELRHKTQENGRTKAKLAWNNTGLEENRVAQVEKEDEIEYATPEEVESELAGFFGAERYAEIKVALAVGILDTLPSLPKALSEYVNEDREDRV